MVTKLRTSFGRTMLIIIGVIAAMFAVGLVFALLTSDGESRSIAAIAPTETPAPTQSLEPTTPVENPESTQVFSGGVGNAPAATSIPTSTPMPTYIPNPTYTPHPAPTFTPYPTYTPYPTPLVGPTYTPYPTFTPSPIPTPTIVPTPRAQGMQLSVNGTPLDPGQTVFGIVNGMLVFNPAPDEFGEYEQDSTITVTAFPTVAGSTVIMSGVNKLSANTGTILARGTQWSMTAFITLPPSAPTPVETATAVPTPTPTPTGPMLTPTPTQQYTQGVTGSSTASATATPTPGQTPTPTQQYTQGVTGN